VIEYVTQAGRAFEIAAEFERRGKSVPAGGAFSSLWPGTAPGSAARRGDENSGGVTSFGFAALRAVSPPDP
jgi:hypothetical protein